MANHTLLPMPAKMSFMTIKLTVSKLTASQQHSTSAGGQISTVLLVPYDTLNFKLSNISSTPISQLYIGSDTHGATTLPAHFSNHQVSSPEWHNSVHYTANSSL